MTEEGTPLADSSAILWDEVRRQMVRQEADLDNLRGRAVALLSVSSLVAAVFGAAFGLLQAHPGYRVGFLITALVSFTLGVLCVVVVLSPWQDWEFARVLDDWFAKLEAGNDELVNPLQLNTNLAKDFEKSREENNRKLRTMYRWFWFACLFTGLEVVLWALAVAL